MTLMTTLETAPVTAPSKACLCGCQRPIEASSGRGRPTLYATAGCRRSVEYRARKEQRATKPVAHPRDSRETLSVRIDDPGKLARQWLTYRYPAEYRPCGDGRNPSGFRTLLAAGSYPARVETITTGDDCRIMVKMVKGADIEITELAKWMRSLPRPQQSDFAFRAVEVFSSHGMTRSLMRGPDDRVSHDVLDNRIDPVTLRELRDFYAPDECLQPGCHHPAHGHGLCRSHYDQRRNGTLA
jgi:hypothetical protein